MKRAKYLVLSVSVVALASCAKLPITDKNLPVPDISANWTVAGTKSADVNDGWLNDLNVDALTDFVAEVLKNNPGFQAQTHQMMSAGYNLKVTQGNFYPTLDAALGDSRRSIQNPFTPSNNISLGLNARWEIDVWSRLSAQTGASRASYNASRADLAGARLSLAAQVAQNWFDIIEAQDQVDLAYKTVKSFERAVKIARDRFSRGLNTGLDLRLIISSLEDSRASLSSRKNQLSQQKRRLEILAGRYPSAQVVATGKIPNLEEDVPAGLPITLLERRPDLQAARAKLVSAGYNSKAAKKALLPSLVLTANGNNTSPGFDNILNFNNIFWNVLANISQPIFRGGKLRYTAKAQQELFEAEKHNFATTVLAAFKEVEDALASERALKEQVIHTRTAAEKAVDAEKVALDQYGRGLIKVSVLLQSQRQSLGQQSKLILVKKQKINNRIALYLALGGDFAIREDIQNPVSKNRSLQKTASIGKSQ